MVPAWQARPGEPAEPAAEHDAAPGRDGGDRRRRLAPGRAVVPGGRASGRAGDAGRRGEQSLAGLLQGPGSGSGTAGGGR